MMNEVIAFLGTGLMGEPMARHLLAAGYGVRVWNRSKEKTSALAEKGAIACDAPAEAAQGANTLICMLSDGPTCDAVLFHDEAVLLALAPDATLIVMSSIPVETAVEQARMSAERGVRYLDAPVSGGQRGAIDGTLAIMAGGDPDTFDAARELLGAMGRPVRVGLVGTGQQTKLANQLIVASTIATVAEALLFAERGGADPAKVIEALAGGFADSPILRMHGQRMIDETFAPGGAAKYQLKDTRTALARARSLGLELPVGHVVDALFASMVDHGDGDLDHSALIREIRRANALSASRKDG
ncbi:2-hydroxy-3-oxopropionate reductase [Caballeronia mineralivorans PML1(12)]|uniref:2-hydroxy-3-oxopropionate reductase n=1 Tax=Caballeronia mineralivorans PML1(12) TaxID=908627 RepID=A0A0J1CRQ8_9BURK|nr:NAD(P)-dependent oxidoreductase [Caballeronia mineralivorans]KLU23310.1 2-hydroxy-3-oxopropionate reductase [Caballeronia mineralivorans PML1(12)]